MATLATKVQYLEMVWHCRCLSDHGELWAYYFLREYWRGEGCEVATSFGVIAVLAVGS